MVGSIVVAAVVAVVLLVVIPIFYRVVVPTNDVHIVQSAKDTVSYGKAQAAGNVYYNWPAALPKIGVRTIKLPVSVFDLHLEGYAGYDKGRVPFLVDIMAFFRITEPNVAAERITGIKEMNEQLHGILQSAARAILATSEIEEILEGRSKFGEMFTAEVNRELVQWGVQTVKNIEFMDIRDAQGSQVITNIMAKKKSHIEMQSRIEVAQNVQKAQMAEIDAQRAVKTQEQDALQQIGQRTAEKDKAVGLANAARDREIGIAGEQAAQDVKEQKRLTAEKEMNITQVQLVRAAEIKREVEVVNADQIRLVAITGAEGEKQKTILVAEGNLEAARREAEAVAIEGKAKGEAETAVNMAGVTPQLALAKEIGSNEPYQRYLLGVRTIEKDEKVGMEQATMLGSANVKIIANAGTPVDGAKSIMDLMTSKGGLQLGAAIEAFGATEAGERVMGALGVKAAKNGDARR